MIGLAALEIKGFGGNDAARAPPESVVNMHRAKPVAGHLDDDYFVIIKLDAMLPNRPRATRTHLRQ
jgi:hypothetical protein